MKSCFLTGTIFCFFFNPFFLKAQQAEQKPVITFKNGIGISNPDSTFSINFRFRAQNRIIYNTFSTSDFSASEIEARTRRLRLRMEGFMFDPRFTYYIQLSFSRGDMDWNVRDNSAINFSPNVVRDAVVYYKAGKNLLLVFGQTKLPGNRQRVISSGDQQFIDRSIVNAAFNIDRDFGVQAHYKNQLSGFVYQVKTAISTGEGRNAVSTDAGLSYTGRIELQPFGDFTNRGDNFEGDLEREQRPKLSLAGGMNYNEKARRTGGQLGRDLYAGRDITTFIFDALFKYKGFAFYGEYLERKSDDPVTMNAASDIRYVLTGAGRMVQASYLFKNNLEVSGRAAAVTPSGAIRDLDRHEEVYTLGATKYLRGHRLKLQSNLSWHRQENFLPAAVRNFWSLGFQVEAGI